MLVDAKRNEVWFVDMDGTIAEWRSGMDDQLRTPGYFRNLKPTGFLAPFKEYAAMGGEIYTLSSYLTDCQALPDKHGWVDEYLPEVKRERRLFVPCGVNKADFVKKWFGLDTLTEQMILFDDYSKNLHEWKAAGGKGIKCYNGINGNHGTWIGAGVMWSVELMELLKASMERRLMEDSLKASAA